MWDWSQQGDGFTAPDIAPAHVCDIEAALSLLFFRKCRAPQSLLLCLLAIDATRPILVQRGERELPMQQLPEKRSFTKQELFFYSCVADKLTFFWSNAGPF